MKDNAIMTLQKFSITGLLALALLVALPGCGDTVVNKDGTAAGASTAPPAGSYVYVQFRRDYLGFTATTPSAPTAEGMGSSGTLKELTPAFVVLKVDNEAGRELWIPREAVLMMDVRPAQ